MKKHSYNLTSRYSRYGNTSTKLNSNRASVNRGCQDSRACYPPAAVTVATSRHYSDVASNAATACTHLHSTANNSPILFSKPRVDSKWIWQQDPLPKQPAQPISYSTKMQSPYVRKLETCHHGDHRSLHHDYTAEELERINMKCKAWLESCTPWLP